MGLFNFLKPVWYQNLQQHFRPTNSKTIHKLEALRMNLNIPDEHFTMNIMMTPWGVRKLQWHMYEQAKQQFPNSTEREIWEMVFISRINVKFLTIDMPSDIGSTPLTGDEILDIVNNKDEIINNFNSFSDLVDYLVELDKKENRFFDPSGLTIDIDRILSDY